MDPNLIYFNVSLRTQGTTPLHEASIRGLSDIFELLVRAGADRDILDNAGFSADDMASLQSPPSRRKGISIQ